CPITEDQDKLPLMPDDPRNPFGMDYGMLKRRCEDVLWRAHEEGRFQVSMLRPPFVCGPNDPTIRDLFWIERIRDGGPLLVPGCGDFAFQHVFVDDVARAFTALLDHPATVGHAYNVAADEIFTLNEYLRNLSRLLESAPLSPRRRGSGSTTVGSSGSTPSSPRRRGSTTSVNPSEAAPEIIHIPQAVFDRQPFSSNPRGDVFPFNTRRTAVLSLEAIRRDLSYRSTPFDSWMPAAIEWYAGFAHGSSHGYALRPDEIAFAREWKSRTSAFQ
ncbi:MAG TPA: NAD-dependent epimerase/dehydratase family protein, partial [Rhodothermia bacterium]